MKFITQVLVMGNVKTFADLAQSAAMPVSLDTMCKQYNAYYVPCALPNLSHLVIEADDYAVVKMLCDFVTPLAIGTVPRVKLANYFAFVDVAPQAMDLVEKHGLFVGQITGDRVDVYSDNQQSLEQFLDDVGAPALTGITRLENCARIGVSDIELPVDILRDYIESSFISIAGHNQPIAVSVLGSQVLVETNDHQAVQAMLNTLRFDYGLTPHSVRMDSEYDVDKTVKAQYTVPNIRG